MRILGAALLCGLPLLAASFAVAAPARTAKTPSAQVASPATTKASRPAPDGETLPDGGIASASKNGFATKGGGRALPAGVTAGTARQGVLPRKLPRTGFGWLLLQMVLVLLAVSALAYVVLRWGLRRFQAGAGSRTPGMRVLGHIVLEPRRSLFVVEVGERFFLVGTSEQGLSLLTELDSEAAAQMTRGAADPSGKTSFREALFGRGKKK